MTHRESSTPPASAATSTARNRAFIRLVGFGEAAARYVRQARELLRDVPDPALSAGRATEIDSRLSAALHCLEDTNDSFQPMPGTRFAITPAGRAALTEGLEPIGDVIARSPEAFTRNGTPKTWDDDARFSFAAIDAEDARRPYGAASSSREFAPSDVTTVTTARASSTHAGICAECHQPLRDHPIELFSRDGQSRLICIPPANVAPGSDDLGSLLSQRDV